MLLQRHRTDFENVTDLENKKSLESIQNPLLMIHKNVVHLCVNVWIKIMSIIFSGSRK